LSIGRTFDLIFLPFYTFNYLLTPADQRAAILRLKTHLAPTGSLILDVLIPLSRLRNCPAGPVLQADRMCLETGRRFRAWNSYHFDLTAQLEIRRHRFELEAASDDTRVAEFETRRRYSFRAELARLFGECGFDVESVTSGYEGQPAVADSEQLLYVLRHRD
jgi:hypothetical protein